MQRWVDLAAVVSALAREWREGQEVGGEGMDQARDMHNCYFGQWILLTVAAVGY